jgi:type III restriction enzyme
MSDQTLNNIKNRLSLRAPQTNSLSRLAHCLNLAPELLGHAQDLPSLLSKLQSAFPKLEDFERDFPSLCFALATGVGKTRLMGAFVAYLHIAHKVNNFFILAPNLTIYNKLITDFTRNTPKYVFKGIAEFAQQPPLIITGDNYDKSGAMVTAQPAGFEEHVRINIFNIAKINSEVRGGKEPRIKRIKEVLGESYFNHLANLPDLVLLMDESHRYRASAGVRSINELKPFFGLELTATPFVEAGANKTIPFKNVIMDYPLSQAMEDGFVKEPAVVTQRNFDAKLHKPEEIEKIKLEDGIRLHETTKVELLTYARENKVNIVKPFMLVIARDTTHASNLLSLLESKEFYEGRYKGKVIQVDSSRTGAEEEVMISRLLAVESRDEPTEIVIHVNMLKEGWDVTNLYTIVPLRAANARTLIEQSIGRGLRLPYGKRTGVASVDRLNIVAHDKFQEIVDEANRSDSPIRLKQIILDPPSDFDKKTSVQINPLSMIQMGLAPLPELNLESQTNRSDFIYPLAEESLLAHQARSFIREAIADYEIQPKRVPTSDTLLEPIIQSQLLKTVRERLQTEQGDLFAEDKTLDLSHLIAQTTENFVQNSIDIPRITIVPKGEVSRGFNAFTLDVSQLHLQPGKQEIIVQMLRTHEQVTLSKEPIVQEQRLEDYIVLALRDFDDIEYSEQADLLYDLASQMVRHLLSYLSEEEAHTVLAQDGRLIAHTIHAQMRGHFWEKAAEYEAKISRGFTDLLSANYTIAEKQPIRHFRETVEDIQRIREILFEGFAHCLYPMQKFDSGSELRFSIILDRDAKKWFKPLKGQFQIYYKFESEQSEYIPDFVAETEQELYLIEIKKQTDMDDAKVQSKAKAASTWCYYATEYALEVGSKKWNYLLIPHDEINESKKMADYLRFEVK